MVCWSPDSQYLAFANQKQIHILNIKRQLVVCTYTGHAFVPTSLKWSPNGRYIASASFDGTVQIWDAFNGNQRFLYQGHQDAVYDVAWSPDGAFLASGGLDATVLVWKPPFSL